MRKLSKTLLSLLLIAAMLASFVVLPAAAEEPAAEQPTEAVQAAETQSKDAVDGFDPVYCHARCRPQVLFCGQHQADH